MGEGTASVVERGKSQSQIPLDSMRISSDNDPTPAEGPTRQDVENVEMGELDVSSTGREEFSVGWVGENEDDDPGNPRNMSKARKWLVSLVVSLGAACV
jgi:hypothetical protein